VFIFQNQQTVPGFFVKTAVADKMKNTEKQAS